MLRLIPRLWWLSSCTLLWLAACGGAGGDAAPVIDMADAGRPRTDAGADAGTEADAGTSPEVPAVPMERVTLGGRAYLAWQRPGDTFRIVCEEPCPIDERYIHARYAGFLAVKDELISLTGIDVLPRMTPVDIHLAGDGICGAASPSLAGASFMNMTGFMPGPGANVCLWELEASRAPPPYVARPLTVENALARESQVLLVHEYSHVLSFLRHDISHEWLVRALSYRVGGQAPSLCDPMNREFAPTAWELCQRNGFDFQHLAASFTELESLYVAGEGAMEGSSGQLPPTSVFQWRRILDRLTGGDTFAACVARGELYASQCGDSARFTPEGGTVRMYGDAVRWELPAGALAAPVEVLPGSWRLTKTVPEPWSDFTWRHTFAFEPSSVTFAAPVRLTLRYDAGLIPAGATADSLALYRMMPLSAPEIVAGAQVDPTARTVSATVPGLGRYVLAPR